MHAIVATDGSWQSLAAARQLKAFADPAKFTDVSVVAVCMPTTHTDEGLRAALELRRRHPQTGVLVLSQYIETRYSAQLLEGGAAGVGYLLKDRVASLDVLTDALTTIRGGGNFAVVPVARGEHVIREGEVGDAAYIVRAGKLQVWSLGSSAASPDGQGSFQRLHGPQAGLTGPARESCPVVGQVEPVAAGGLGQGRGAHPDSVPTRR